MLFVIRLDVEWLSGGIELLFQSFGTVESHETCT